MRIVFVLAGTAALAWPALAAPSERTVEVSSIVDQARACTNLTLASDTFEVAADITLAAGSPKKIEVKSFSPSGSKGEFTASAIARGLALCGPYEKLDGVFALTVTEADFAGEGVEIVMPTE